MTRTAWYGVAVRRRGDRAAAVVGDSISRRCTFWLGRCPRGRCRCRRSRRAARAADAQGRGRGRRAARAGAAIDRVHARMGEFLKPGRTEAQVAADIAAAIVEEGTRRRRSSSSARARTARPAPRVSDRVIQAGDVVVIDIGGPCEPATTPTPPAPTPSASRGRGGEAYAVLQHAQERRWRRAARGHRRGGRRGRPRVGRRGTGGGVHPPHRPRDRPEVHEEPYIVGGNNLPLEPGMAFSVSRALLRRRVGRPHRGHRRRHRRRRRAAQPPPPRPGGSVP